MLPKALAASLVSALLLTPTHGYVPAKRSHTPSRSSSASVRPSSTAVSGTQTSTATATATATATSTGISTGTGTGSTSVIPSVSTGTGSTRPSSTPGVSPTTRVTTGTDTSTGTSTGTNTGSTRPSSTPGVSTTTTGTATGTDTGTATGTGTGTGTNTGTNSGTTRPSSTPGVSLTTTETNTTTGTGTGTGTGTNSGTTRPSSTPGVSTTTTGTATRTDTGTATGTTTGTTTGTATGTETGTATGTGTATTGTATGTTGTTGTGTTTGITGTTTAPTTATTTPAYLLSSFVISDSITVPAQTSTESGTFSTTTLSATGPPNSYSATTTTGSDHHPTILPVWFNSKGHPVIVLPISVTGPPGIIPPPPGFPTLDIGPDGNPTPDPNNDPSNSPTETQPSQTQTQTTHSTGTTTATTTTASTGTTTTASTTTASTTTSTSGSTTYLIVPTDSASSSDRDSFQSTLEDQVGKSNVQASADDENGVGFWMAPLNSSQVQDFSGNSIISYITPDSLLPVDDFTDPTPDSDNDNDDNDVSARAVGDSHGYFLNKKKRAEPHYEELSPIEERAAVSLAKRATPKQQSNAVQDLVVVSQAKNTIIELLPNIYQYDPTAGKGITVYVVDSGATPSNSEYSGMPGSKRWLYPGFGSTPDKDEDDKVGHGTCVLSKAAGPQYGVAKNVDVVVVKLQANTIDGGFKIPSSAFMDALLEIRKDISDNKLQGKAVINFSFGIELYDSDQNKATIKRLLQEINGMDVPMTVASGNSARESNRKNVDRYPALFASDIDGLIVVGAVDNIGDTATFSQGGPLLHISAPGNKITCADSTGGSKTGCGTSYAAPQVAGLIAYFMSLPGNGLGSIGSGQIPGNVKNLLINSASYPRKSGGDNVLWNMQSVDCGSGTNNKRDGSGSCSVTTSISGVTATTTTATSTGSTQTQTTTGTTSVSTSVSTGVSSTSLSTVVSTTLATTTSQPPTTTAATTTTASTTSLPASLTCASSSDPSIPTGLPQPTMQKDLDEWCKSIDQDYGNTVACDNKNHGGYMLADSSVCDLPNYSFGLQYYETGATLWFNISLAEGSAYVVNSTLCSTAMNQVLNGCPPFEADKSGDLIKYGGSVVLNNGTGGAAEYAMVLKSP